MSESYGGPEGSQLSCDFSQFSCGFLDCSVVIFQTVQLWFFRQFSCDFSRFSCDFSHSSVVTFQTVQLWFLVG